MLDNNTLRILIYSLAVIRVTYLLWNEAGPWEIFTHIRGFVGVYTNVTTSFDDAGKMVVKEERAALTFLGKLLNCPLCLSMHISVLATVAFLLRLWWMDIAALWLAIACISTMYFRKEKS